MKELLATSPLDFAKGPSDRSERETEGGFGGDGIGQTRKLKMGENGSAFEVGQRVYRLVVSAGQQ